MSDSVPMRSSIALTLDSTNPEYTQLVRERTMQKADLDYLQQTQDILQRYSPVNCCLDIGCASGYLFHHIRGVVGHYAGIDASASFIDYGRHFFAGEIAEGKMELVHSHLEEYAPARRYDAVVCLGLFYVFPDFRAYLHRLCELSDRLVVIRALFDRQSVIRYVPQMPGSMYWTYYNIYAYEDIEAFARQLGWRCRWEADRYVSRCNGRYSTGGQEFPFHFLVLTREG